VYDSLARGGIKGIGARANQIGLLRGSTGRLKGLTEMAHRAIGYTERRKE